MPPRRKTLTEKLTEFTTPGDNGCLLWIGKLDRQGYGLVSLERHRWVFAHRAAWFHYHGVWPSGIILHQCDIRNCVNVRHMRDGTHPENVADAIAKGRLDNRGERHGFHKLTDLQVKQIRDQYSKGGISQCELAKIFSTSQANVSRICNKKGWRHVR